jgi:hypothetical protein
MEAKRSIPHVLTHLHPMHILWDYHSPTQWVAIFDWISNVLNYLVKYHFMFCHIRLNTLGYVLGGGGHMKEL